MFIFDSSSPQRGPAEQYGLGRAPPERRREYDEVRGLWRRSPRDPRESRGIGAGSAA